MAVLKFSLISFLILISCVAVGKPLRINIKNDLEKCVTVNDKGLTYLGEIPLLKLGIKVVSETGACGCKSAVNKYSVYQKMDDYEAWVMSGEFTFLGKEELQIPIAAQKRIIGNAENLTLVVGCANP